MGGGRWTTLRQTRTEHARCPCRISTSKRPSPVSCSFRMIYSGAACLQKSSGAASVNEEPAAQGRLWVLPSRGRRGCLPCHLSDDEPTGLCTRMNSGRETPVLTPAWKLT
ncbi:hypothetical protein DPEC_G00361710 [Dallia pectoralis]|nr:hypothetical protein DPEC_G00361710 [Dallia pectoralis]